MDSFKENFFNRSQEENINKIEEKFEPRSPFFKFEDIVLSKDLQEDIDSVISRIENHNILYKDWGLSKIDPFGKRIAVNFYGNPGTGKTMCAEALSYYFKSPIIEINYAEIESKYVGETPKNIVAAFRKAKKAKSILLFDEADSILGRRMTNVTQSADHGVNVSRAVMLRQMDLFSGIVIFCTNLAKNYDQAFVRRILYHIHFNDPDFKTRKLLWKKLLHKDIPGALNLDVSYLAKISNGFTGGDIKNCVISAASSAVVRELNDKKLNISDLKKSIKNIKTSKANVGSSKDKK